MKKLVGLTLVMFATLVAWTQAALAAPKSWDAALATLPAEYSVLFAVNGKTVRSLPSFQTVLTTALSKERDAKKGLEEIKSVCKIDVPQAIDDVTVGFDGDKKVAVFIGLNGADEAKVTKCLQDMVKKEKGKAVTATKTGNIVEYGVPGDKDKLYVGWYSKDVMVVTSDPTSKSSITAVMGGNGAVAKSAAVKSWLSKVSTTAGAFGVGGKEIKDGGLVVKGFAAQVDYASGSFPFKATVQLGSSKDATAAAAEIKKGLQGAPKEIAKSAGSVKVSTSGSEITVEGTIHESEIQNAAKSLK